MDESTSPDLETSFQRLVVSLHDLVKSYRALLNLVRAERDILISADIEKLNESNRKKDLLLVSIRAQEKERQRLARDFAVWIRTDVEAPQLLEMVSRLVKIDPDKAEKLRNHHAMLSLLLKRLAENNNQNEALVKSALNHVTGALTAIKEALTDSPTYEGSGGAHGTQKRIASGQLVRREA